MQWEPTQWYIQVNMIGRETNILCSFIRKIRFVNKNYRFLKFKVNTLWTIKSNAHCSEW